MSNKTVESGGLVGKFYLKKPHFNYIILTNLHPLISIICFFKFLLKNQNSIYLQKFVEMQVSIKLMSMLT